jgi:hypothetical protein
MRGEDQNGENTVLDTESYIDFVHYCKFGITVVSCYIMEFNYCGAVIYNRYSVSD